MIENYISKSAIGDQLIFAVPEADQALKNSRGDNKKALLVVFEEEDGKAHLAFLEKILKAVHFDLEQDALLLALNPETAPSFTTLSKRETVTHALLFGVEPTAMGLYFNYQLYQPLKHRTTHFLFSDSLADLDADTSKKGALWAALKSLFLS